MGFIQIKNCIIFLFGTLATEGGVGGRGGQEDEHYIMRRAGFLLCEFMHMNYLLGLHGDVDMFWRWSWANIVFAFVLHKMSVINLYVRGLLHILVQTAMDRTASSRPIQFPPPSRRRVEEMYWTVYLHLSFNSVSSEDSTISVLLVAI